jgi:predicted enzyme related to lactoylglutathione lyase
MYVVVEDVERSAAECVRLGGQIVAGPRPLMGGLFCVMRDPAGAVCALFEPARVA